MTQTLKNHWKLLSWRLGCIVLIALLHNWAMAALLVPPALSAPAGQKARFSVAVQFTHLAPTQSQQLEPTTKEPDERLDKQRENAAPERIPKSIAQQKSLVEAAEQPKQTVKKSVKELLPESQLETINRSARNTIEPEQVVQISNQAANGAHQEVIVTEPLFASPPMPPRYPTIARKRGQEGTVLLDVWLDAQGKQSRLAIAKTSGLSVLDESALKAVRQWEFEAYQAGGVNIASRVRIPVEFSLN